MGKAGESGHPPGSGGARLARLGRAGAVVAGRSAGIALRQLAAEPERRRELAEARSEANALTWLEAAGDLRGLVAKLGQLLSQQGHSLPEAYARRLTELQQAAPPMHPSLARIQVRNALGDWPEDRFARWEPRAFAAASLGQVHRAWLPDGRALAVKIQYPGIRRAVESDFRLLEGSLTALQRAGHKAGAMGEAMGHLRQRLIAETDYRAEAESLTFFQAALATVEGVGVPGVALEHSGEHILSMDFLPGQSLERWLAGAPSPARRDALGTRLLDLFFHQVFRLHRFHADPHPGNLLVDADDSISWVDFGCVEMLDALRAELLRGLYGIPLENEAALDAQYQALELYAAGEPHAEARREALLALQAANVGRYHSGGRFDFGRPEPMQTLAACLREVTRLGIATGPLILFERTQFGLYNLLHRIGARVDCRKVIAPYLQPGPSSDRDPLPAPGRAPGLH